MRWFELKYRIWSKWHHAYHDVKSIFVPGNVIKLKNLDRSWQETDMLMEEAIFQLLSDFFRKQQPFHLQAGLKYDKKDPDISRTKEVFELVKRAAENSAVEIGVWEALIDIAERYEAGEFRKWEATNDCWYEEELHFVIKYRAWLWT